MKTKHLTKVLGLSLILILAMNSMVFATSTTKQLDNMEIMENTPIEKIDITSTELISNDVEGFKQYEVTTPQDKLNVYTEFNTLSTQEVDNYINQANYAIKQELAVGELKAEETPDIIQYIYTDGNAQVTYLEGETENGVYVKDMFITEATTEDEFASVVDKPVKDTTISPRTPGNFDKGIGIRAVANQDGQYMTGSFANCPPLNVDKSVNGVPNTSYSYYHYFGFERDSKTNSDMGVMYSPALKGWLPYMKLNQNGNKYMIDSTAKDVIEVGYEVNELAGATAYGMSSPITISVYKSIDAYNGGGKVVRLTTRGTSIASKQPNVMCIAEAGTGISDAVTWRALTTIAGTDNIPAASNASAPRIEMNFTGVKIGTQNATWSGTVEDRGTIVSKGSGAVRGKINF